MRDIRSDLQERANVIDEQIKAAYAHFQKRVEQIQHERDAKIADLKSEFAMIAKFMDFEQRFLGNVSPPVSSSPLVALADLFHAQAQRGRLDVEGGACRPGCKGGLFPRLRKSSPGRAPYARQHAAQRANPRVAKRDLRASYFVASHEA
jgi:hypothetical protein